MKLKEKKEFWNAIKTGEFANMVQETAKGQALNNGGEVYNLLKPLMANDPNVEQAWFIFLDAKNKVIQVKKMFTGSVTSSAIYPREVIKECLKVGAAALIMSHNHPSGDSEPSPEDYTITFQMIIACKTMGITLHEHMVIGDCYYSMADCGYITKFNRKYNELTMG